MDDPILVDTGNDSYVPLVFSYAKTSRGFLTKLAGDVVEPAMLLSTHPEYVIQNYRDIQWFDLFRTGKVNAFHVVCGEWGNTLTRETAEKLGITMESLIKTGLTCVNAFQFI